MGDIREASGNVDSDDPVVALLYVLLRDHVHPSDMAALVKDLRKASSFRFSNGWLAQYAQFLANDLRSPVLKPASDWQVAYPGIVVMDPDGWRHTKDGVTWDTPITEAEYWRRVGLSTCDWSRASKEEMDKWKFGAEVD